MSDVRYLFDANSLIEAKNFYYNPEFNEAFWEWLLIANQNNVLFTIDKVIYELTTKSTKQDYLKSYMQQNEAQLALKSNDNNCVAKYGELQVWANEVWTLNKDKRKATKALEEFADIEIADCWLIAYASVHGFEIITNETPAPSSATKVKIPDAATAFGVKTVRLHEVLSKYAHKTFTFKLPAS
jgi:Domain of unknown function (DUF4411)